MDHTNKSFFILTRKCMRKLSSNLLLVYHNIEVAYLCLFLFSYSCHSLIHMFRFSCIDGFRVLLPALTVSWLASSMQELGEVALAETVNGDAKVAKRGGCSGFLTCWRSQKRATMARASSWTRAMSCGQPTAAVGTWMGGRPC